MLIEKLRLSNMVVFWGKRSKSEPSNLPHDAQIPSSRGAGLALVPVPVPHWRIVHIPSAEGPQRPHRGVASGCQMVRPKGPITP